MHDHCITEISQENITTAKEYLKFVKKKTLATFEMEERRLSIIN